MLYLIADRMIRTPYVIMPMVVALDEGQNRASYERKQQPCSLGVERMTGVAPVLDAGQ